DLERDPESLAWIGGAAEAEDGALDTEDHGRRPAAALEAVGVLEAGALPDVEVARLGPVRSHRVVHVLEDLGDAVGARGRLRNLGDLVTRVARPGPHR